MQAKAKASTERSGQGQGQGQAAMKMKTSSNKKMRGFMCQTPAATAVCTSTSSSVIVPRRPDRTLRLLDHSTFINNVKYSRLAESRRFPPSVHNKRSLMISPVPIKTDLHPPLHHQHEPNPLHNSSNSLTTPSHQLFQVVVMRVSLHCQGCAGKVKKHLSKMEGVTSFSIDLETKRVTVMGHVSPEGVVESISKVKRAELWPC